MDRVKKSRFSANAGVAFLEYTIVILLVAFVATAFVSRLQTNITRKYAHAACAVGGTIESTLPIDDATGGESNLNCRLADADPGIIASLLGGRGRK